MTAARLQSHDVLCSASAACTAPTGVHAQFHSAAIRVEPCPGIPPRKYRELGWEDLNLASIRAIVGESQDVEHVFREAFGHDCWNSGALIVQELETQIACVLAACIVAAYMQTIAEC
jgi:hypothetical protein